MIEKIKQNLLRLDHCENGIDIINMIDDFDSLIYALFTPLGIEFAEKSDLNIVIDVLQKIDKDVLYSHGILLDYKGTIKNNDQVVVLGDSVAKLEYDLKGIRNQVIIISGDVEIEAKEWATVFVTSKIPYKKNQYNNGLIL